MKRPVHIWQGERGRWCAGCQGLCQEFSTCGCCVDRENDKMSASVERLAKIARAMHHIYLMQQAVKLTPEDREEIGREIQRRTQRLREAMERDGA